MRKIFNLKFKIFNSARGITLFIAIIIMSILLFISFAVTNIAIKGILFASSGRDSQYAFYAADSGIECAIYWDTKFNEFATSTPGTISCAGNPAISTASQSPISGTTTSSLIGGGGANSTSVFGFVMNQQGSSPMPYCAIVTVNKYYVGNNLTTYIESRGYNTCDTSNPRRVERGVEVTY